MNETGNRDRTGRRMITLIPSDGEYSRALLRGVVQYAHLHGPWVFYEEPPVYVNPAERRRQLALMRNWNGDGIILVECRAADLEGLRLPAVMVCDSRYLPAQTCQVRTDDGAIGNMGADHLLGLGFKHLAYCGMEGIDWSTERGAAFRRRGAESGFDVHMYTLGHRYSSEDWYREDKRLGDWLTALPKPTGLLACNDERARMLAEICRVRSIRVPEEIAILGVDNDEHVCNRATPPLSSIALAAERAGYEAAAMLDARMSGQPVRRCVILTPPTRVVPRQSTNRIAIDDAAVAKALRFIRDESSHIIRARDVATVAGLSRRVLQERFRRALGRTLLKEIHHCRAEHISRLLAETDLPISAIATAVGYETDAHLARFFARQAGLSPSAYRLRHRRE